MVISSQIDVKIDTKNVHRSIGYIADSQPQPRISALIEEYAAEAYHLIVPSYSFVIRDVELVLGSRVFVQGSGDLISNLIVFQSEAIAQLLSECRRVALFVVTIGKYLEEMVCQLAEDGLMLQASVLDAIGSDAVVKVADFVEGVIKERAGATGLGTSRRFSPGYCDWDISQQRGVFRAVKGDSVGVHLTESYMMVPQKSISGLIGIGPSGGGLWDYNPCETCSKSDCSGRR